MSYLYKGVSSMAKSKKFHSGSTGTILTVLYQEKWKKTWRGEKLSQSKKIAWLVGTPIRMYPFDPNSDSHLRQICLRYHITDEALVKLIADASQHPNKHQFMTL